MSNFTDALSAFIAAEREFHEEASACNRRGIPMERGFERALAQAGDVLERELRQMMREERQRVFNEEEGRTGFPHLKCWPASRLTLEAGGVER